MKLWKAEDWGNLTFENAAFLFVPGLRINIYQRGLGYKSGSHSSVLIYLRPLIQFQTLFTLCPHLLPKHYLSLDTSVRCPVYQHAFHLIITISHWSSDLLPYISSFHLTHPQHTPPLLSGSGCFHQTLYLPTPQILSVFHPAMLDYL